MSPKHCKCGADSRVVDSRTGDRCLRRRRECPACGARWSTREYRDDDDRRLYRPTTEQALALVARMKTRVAQRAKDDDATISAILKFLGD